MYSVKCLAHLPWNINKVKTVLLGCRTPKMQDTNPRFKKGYTCRWLQTSPLVGHWFSSLSLSKENICCWKWQFLKTRHWTLTIQPETGCWNRMQRKNSIHRISAYNHLGLQQWESFSGVVGWQLKFLNVHFHSLRIVIYHPVWGYKCEEPIEKLKLMCAG
jgi:hypothetical protein